VTMRALTLHRPWDWAILHAGKDCENRTWKPPASALGQRLAIHAGKVFDVDGMLWMESERGLTVPGKSSHPSGVVTGVVTLVGWITPDCADMLTFEEYDRARASRWYCGRVGWVLADPIPLAEPVPCRGAQGIWRLPPDVEEKVRRRIPRPSEPAPEPEGAEEEK